MNANNSSDESPSAGPEVEACIGELEQQMARLYQRHASVSELASAWEERYGAVMAMVAPADRAAIEARLARIGIHWGVMPDARVTCEFRVSDVAALARARRRMHGRE
jgi:hypothetical protein